MIINIRMISDEQYAGWRWSISAVRQNNAVPDFLCCVSMLKRR